MAKGQKKSGREPKKPKADKKPSAGSAASPLRTPSKPPAKSDK